MKIGIKGSGVYLPDVVVKNDDFVGIVETSDEWIRSRTGIESRHMTAGEAAWYMGAQAAKKALDMADLQGSDIDLILVTTVTPDYATPSVSCLIQAEIKAVGAFTIDLNAACSGFVYAYDMAARYLLDPAIRNVLIVSTEVLTRITDFTDRASCVLFGDGASAVVVGRTETGELLGSKLGADGASGGVLLATNASSQNKHPWWPEDAERRFPDRFDNELSTLRMEGREVYRFAVTVMSESILDVLNRCGLTVDDLDMVVPHQANNRILEAAAKRMDIPMDKVWSGLKNIGNTSSASIGIGLDTLLRDGSLKAGDLVAICGFGGGLTYGAALFRI